MPRVQSSLQKVMTEEMYSTLAVASAAAAAAGAAGADRPHTERQAAVCSVTMCDIRLLLLQVLQELTGLTLNDKLIVATSSVCGHLAAAAAAAGL
jgi:hypothetical protein